MSRNALEQLWETILRLEETVDGLSKANPDHITYNPMIMVPTKKVGSPEVSLVEVVAQVIEPKVDILSATDIFKQQFFSNELTLFKRVI